MTGSSVRLPRDVRPPFEVYVNGVRQTEGVDFELRGGTLAFASELVEEGRLGLWRWALGAIGIGTYRDDHSVDVRYVDADGRAAVVEHLAIEPAP